MSICTHLDADLNH